ncbi:glucose-6-phosphate isomerase [Candidatus Proelusimicrobium volucris]|uniref:glucose-6-phosphate isomerase n=1 Tax=Candidatus Proelusimicrobium volucris TaxID=3416225 RepID=UPI003D0FBCB6
MKVSYNKSAEEIINKGLAKLEGADFTARLYRHDASLWKSEEAHTKIINNSLGWTEVYDWTLQRLPEIKNFAEEAKKEFDHVVLMGMGGSSLAPEVLRVIFGKSEGWPELLVLDSTNPDWVSSVRSKIDPAKTLFIFASKSGGTVEPSSQFAYFYDEVSKVKQDAGDNFIAITDPGTGLETLATEKKFRKIFTNKADIGGRFSALSFFGMVPAALSGIDVEKILLSAKEAGEEFKSDKVSAAVKLGALMGGAYAEGKDKLTLVMPSSIEVFGLWVEQLVAESTGKEDKGVVPVAGEKLHKGFDYKSDRIFAGISCDCACSKAIAEEKEAIKQSAHPFFEAEMKDKYAIGSMFLLWEVATAACGALMGIDPFDQPNVQAAKTIAKNLLNDLAAGKTSEETYLDIIVSDNLKGKVNLATLGADIKKVLSGNDYLAILPYVHNSKAADELFSAIRDGFLTATKHAVLFGYGPRYLHSTGQLHKGDGNNGVFLIISADADNDVKIPGAAYGFKDLVNAQALGDFKALAEKGRRVIKVHVKKPVLAGLEKLKEVL